MRNENIRVEHARVLRMGNGKAAKMAIDYKLKEMKDHWEDPEILI